MRLGTLVQLVLIVVLGTLAVGCGGSQGGGSVALPVVKSLDPVADATSNADSARFEMQLQFQMPGVSGFESGFGFSASGAYDNPAKKARMTMDLGSFAELMSGLAGSFGGKTPSEFADPEKWKLDLLVDGTVAYMRLPFLSGQLPYGKDWVRLDLERAARLQGLDLSELQSFAKDGDPRAALAYLRSVSGPLTHVGTEEIRGIPTSHYFAVVEWQKAVAQAARQANELGVLEQLQGLGGVVQNIPVDVWVDKDNLVRRMTMEISASTGGQEAGASISMELFDYGQPVDVSAPPAADVVDVLSLGG